MGQQREVFDFRVALTILKQGGKVIREPWLGDKDLHLGLKNPSRGSDSTISYFFIQYKQGKSLIITPWTPSHNDILSEDWMVYE